MGKAKPEVVGASKPAKECIQALSAVGKRRVGMEEKKLPKFDYYLDESDPDIVVLRRQDGSFVAAFSVRGPRGKVSWRPPGRTTRS